MKAKALLLFVLILCGLIFVSAVIAVNCWDYSDETNCNSAGLCMWQDDPFGTGWCEQLDCWSFWTNETCLGAVTTYNLSCNWQLGSAMSGWCEELSCWSFDGTNQTRCETYTDQLGLNCEWHGTDGNWECSGPWERNCGDYNTEAACENSSGCTWGTCTEKGCWSYTSASTCNAEPNCAWDYTYDYCEEDSCWSPKYNTSASCNNVSDTKICRWNSNYGGYCEDFTCHTFDYNETGCTNALNDYNLDCDWESSSNMCMEKGCWSYWTENDCTGKVANGKNCTWRISTTQNTGWCEKISCWSFDNVSANMSGLKTTNESYCVNNTYNLSCTYDPNGGWCFQDIGDLSCANLTDQRKCWDTMWCFWDEFSQTCSDPTGGVQGGAIGGTGGGAGFKAPPCAVFYMNESNCNNVTGCYYNESLNGTARCVTDNPSITENGLNCTVINNSELCNSIPFLPHCCEWQGTNCTENKFTTSCWDNLATPPDGATYCEDTSSYNTESKCNKIANYPWYMPCVWNNATGAKRCEFANDFFGQDLHDDEKGDMDLIDNKMACEKGSGGSWITETYCGEGTLWNISITAGRCAPKLGVAGGNCHLSCSDCEYSSNGQNHSTESAARTECENSDLGFCEWISDENAPNGLGRCKPKKEFQKGAVSKCTSTNCDACNMYQSAKAQEKCIEAQCEWAVDPLDPTIGTCIAKGEQTCVESCSACNSQQACSEKGRGGPSQANDYTSPCTWDETYGICKRASSGSDTNSEICFNGIDDDGDNNIDCGDSGCFSDPFCGGGSMIDCFQYNNNATCSNTTGCYWFNDTFGGWCDMKSAICWQNDGDMATCHTLNDSCTWHEPPPGSDAMCNLNESIMDICHNYNSSDCATDGNCSWYIDQWCADNPTQCGENAGWCGHAYEICWMNSTLNSDSAACNNAFTTVDVQCQWMSDSMAGGGYCEPPCFSLGSSCATNPMCETTSGFCDPIGFGGGGSETFDCWQYDNDQVQCDNQTACTWMIEPRPFCDMMMGYDCGQFGNDKASCVANGNCTWINETEFGNTYGGTWCGMKSDQCFMNHTLQNASNTSICNANPSCHWEGNWSSCEPIMFTQGADDAQSCQQSGGLWRTGWCNPAGMAGMFTGMAMDSPPVPLGSETCSEDIPAYIDICSAGIKDSADNWGLGIGVSDIRDAAMCNGVTTFQGQGSGTATTKFYWYLDTNGQDTGDCTLYSDSNNDGWDLFFQYIARYTNGSLSETRTAYRCMNSQWTITNIQLSSWKEKMCNELQGGMIALNKDDLTNIQGLLNLSTDIRFYMATANGSTNSTNPLDVLGPVYYTPGTIDFMPECCWALGDQNIDCDMDGLAPSNDPDCDFMKGDGFIKFEDCWGDGIDDDGDSLVDCNDPDCTGNTYCVQNHLGVEAVDYVDTTSPKILFFQIEKYPDSALLNFDSDEPTNGTVLFYYNKSKCLTSNLNTTLYDIGIWNNDTPAFKNWHEVEIYNDGGTNSLNYALTANKTYFYKFKVCDESGNCAQSACSNFTTAQSVEKCKKCYFIFNMNLPDGITLDLDLNNTGEYDSQLHRQCGSSAGYLVNYTQARSVNMRFTDNSTTPATEIYLIGTRLTRSIMHNQEIRKINKAQGIKAGTTSTTAGTTVGYAGLDKDITSKLVDKLHPKYCMIKIPGACDTLYHCDDSLANCVDKSSTATINESNSSYCIWKIPCTFSIYAGGQPGSPSTESPSSGGGGGGGGGGVALPSNALAQASHLWALIGTGETVTMTIDSEKIAITEAKFTAKNSLKKASLDIATLKAKPDEVTLPSNTPYQYLEITPSFTEADITKAEIKFTVPRSWIESNNIIPSSIALLRYNEKWTKLSTIISSSDNLNYYFKATLPGFSYFAITGTSAAEEEQVIEETPEEAAESDDITGSTVIEEIPVVDTRPFAFAIVAAIITVAVIIFLIYPRKKKEQ